MKKIIAHISVLALTVFLVFFLAIIISSVVIAFLVVAAASLDGAKILPDTGADSAEVSVMFVGECHEPADEDKLSNFVGESRLNETNNFTINITKSHLT